MSKFEYIAESILQNSMLVHNCELEVKLDNAIQLFATEIQDTYNHYLKHGLNRLHTQVSYRNMYTKLQSKSEYNDMDLCEWEDTKWENVVNSIGDSITDLSKFKELKPICDTLHPHVILGVMWSISHIPNENERNELETSSIDSDSDS